MAKSKTKPVELWPAWESPNRLDYLPKYPRALYDQAGALFTADNIEAASDALNPPDGFDLIGRLRRAVYYYFWCKAGSKGDTGFIDLLPKSDQAKELDDLIKKTDALLSICEKRPGYISSLVKEYADRDGLEAALDFTQGLTVALKRLKEGAEAKKAKTKTVKGNKEDIARRVFCGHLLMIFEAATGTTATTTKAGPAHNFFSVCFQNFIKRKIGDDSTLNYLKDSIRDRDKIKASAFFSKCYDESGKTVPEFSARIVIKPAS
jgi:hypothetical protein